MPEPPPEEPLFLGSRLMTMANLMRRITTTRFQRDFGLGLVDGWIVLRLGAGPAISLDQLAYRSGLAKSQMSRGVTDLVARKLIDRRRNPNNQAELALTLTRAGRAIYKEMIRRAPDYNALLTSGFSAAEVRALTDFANRLIDNSRRNLAAEMAAPSAGKTHNGGNR
ncbi:MAG TPA: MarR family winged helix-turn-helix transcriptional regulator [Hyphomicrobiales bacterium]|nr:MarR family winged helix-turn-helix transcriptional regulator [Hyphomicrobiales bacterium]